MLWRSVSSDGLNDLRSSSNEDPLLPRTMVDGQDKVAIGRGERGMRSRQATSGVGFSTGSGRGSMGDAKRNVTGARELRRRRAAS